MDFYKQYLPLLKSENPNLEKVSRNDLKKNERNFETNYFIEDRPECISEKQPPLYAYSWKEKMELSNGKKWNIRVLKYAHSFYKSGLPMDMGTLQRLATIGSKDFWHFLDIHGASFYLVKDGEETPFALVLAQHNHFRSYVIGKDITF